MTIRDQPVVRTATLPDGRTVEVRVVVPDDPYVARGEIDAVIVELVADGEPLGMVQTPLSADDDALGMLLADRVRAGLESGELEPTAEGIEQTALTSPE
jgi:hypothetical protein